LGGLRHPVSFHQSHPQTLLAVEGGTPAQESIQRDLLCQRAAFLSVVLETMEVKACEGAAIDWGGYVQAVNAFSGLLLRLGLEKRLKNVHDLQTYLEQKDPCKRRTPCPDKDALKYKKNRSA
jgi:hypothetical protein